MSLLLLFNQPVPAETGTSSIVLSPEATETIVEDGRELVRLLASGVATSTDFVAASGTSSIVLSASAAEAIADRNESVFDGGVFDPSVFDVGLSIRLRPTGVGERVGGGIVVGGGVFPQFVLPEPVRRRGTATLGVRLRGRSEIAERSEARLVLEGAGAASLRAGGAARTVLAPGGRRALGVAARTRLRLPASGREELEAGGTGELELEGAGEQAIEWAREAEDEFLLLV